MQHIAPGLVLILGIAVSCTSPHTESVAPGAEVVAPTRAAEPAQLRALDWKSTARVHSYGEIYLASQPQASDLAQAQADGVCSVLDLRAETEERGYDQGALLRELGVPYHIVGFGNAEELTDEVLDRARAALAELPRPLLLHCSSANRVGAVWIAYRTLDLGADLEVAVAEAKTIGLRAAALEQRARDYVAARR